MYGAILLPLAKQDVSEAVQWYNSKQKGLGLRFLENIENQVSIIRKSPKIFPIRYNNIRTCVLNDFPFMIHFTINSTKTTIIIAAIFHTSLDPEMWKLR